MNHFSLRFNTYYRLQIYEYLILAIVLFLCFFIGMGSYGLENVNEGLYGEIPREMLTSGHYVIPSLNFLPYIEKPPLFYWLVAGSYQIFGVSEFSARLIPALSATITCLSLLFLGNKIRHNREGWLAAMMLATSLGFILIARVLLFDMVLTAFFTLSLVCFYIWYKYRDAYYIRMFYGFLACAFLTKGMMSLLLIPGIVIGYLLVSRANFKTFLKFFDLWGMFIFLVIALPWHLLAMKHQAGFFSDFFINEQIYRFLDKRIPHDYHTGSLFFYIPRLFVYIFPWSFLLSLLFTRTTSERHLERFLWVWFLVTFIFFSISRAKGDYYMVVGVPPLVMLLALKINQLFIRKNAIPLIYSFIVLSLLETFIFCLIYLGMTQAKFSSHLPEALILDISYAQAIYTLLLITALYSVFGLILICFNKKNLFIPFVLIAGLTIPLIVFYVIDKQKISNQHSERAISYYIAQHNSNQPVYIYEDYEKLSSLVFYIKKRVGIIDSKSFDLYYGSSRPEAKNWFYSMRDFVQAKQYENHYIVVRKEKFMRFLQKSRPIEYCLLSQSGSAMLLTNNLTECNY